jgi:hypothetical protein
MEHSGTKQMLRITTKFFLFFQLNFDKKVGSERCQYIKVRAEVEELKLWRAIVSINMRE